MIRFSSIKGILNEARWERSTGILPVFAYHFTGETPIVFGMVLLAFSVFKNMTHFTIVL
jgi:hypothetical protein